MIQHAPGPLLSEEQLRSCLIAGFEARKSGHGLVAADQCNSPKEWIKVLSAVSPQLWLLAAEDQKGQLMIDSRFSAQKQSQPLQLADYFYHLTQQVWRGAGFFLGTLPQSLQPRSAGRWAELSPIPATRTSPPLSSRTTAAVSASSSPALPAVIWAHNSASHA